MVVADLLEEFYDDWQLLMHVKYVFPLLWLLQMASRKLEIWQMVCYIWTLQKQFSSFEYVFESPLYCLNMEEWMYPGCGQGRGLGKCSG